jgi:hypothetical protein
MLPYLLAPGFAIACQGEPTTPALEKTLGRVTPAVTDNVVATLKVVPDSQMVFAGDQFQVTAQPKNKSGQVLDRTITWKSSNTSVVAIVGSVGMTMTFKGLKLGNTSVKATTDGLSRFSKVVVRGTGGAKVIVTPSEATVEAGGTVTFVAKGLTKAGETAGVNVTWTTTTGTISAGGVLSAGTAAGVYQVIAKAAFGAADTSLVTVTAGPDPLDAVILVPGSATVSGGETVEFEAYGRTTAGDSVGIDPTYSATAGTITASGVYAAPGTAGTYEVIATSGGKADTAEVTVSAAPLDHVVLVPDIAASRAGEVTRFAAWGVSTAGDSMPDPPSYDATCGAVTSAGVYTAPSNGSGSCVVTASVGDETATTEVVLLSNDASQGTPFGISNLWATNTKLQTSGIAALNSSIDPITPSQVVSHIATARANGIRLVLAMTGGGHNLYKTNGVFDMAKWKAAMDPFNTSAIRDAVAAGVADGTIIGNNVMDEPQQHGVSSDPDKTWGPAGTMTKVRVDSMCSYVKGIFPSLPAGVGHDATVFEPNKSYQVCDFLITQYAHRKGDVTAWRDAALSIGARDNMTMIFSMNLLDGGIQHTKPCPIPETGGDGVTGTKNCRMTAEQIRNWGKLLGQAGCAMETWRYDAAFLAKPENQAAISDVAITLAGMPRTPCTRQ